jgi:anaerobic magnesium-protoporphyrin IX monomethyl ester cyclase
MTRVLIANAYFYRLDPKQWANQQPYPPLGTLLAAAVIRELGFDVTLFDTSLRNTPDEITTALELHRPDYLVIYDDGFNYLTKMCLTDMREAAFTMIRLGKAAGCTVFLSSSDAADHYEKYFQQGVDIVIRGEGEETLRQLLIAPDLKNNISSIAGIVFKDGQEIKVNPVRPVLKDLDALPLPAWDLADIPSYEQIWRRKHGYFSLNLATTRGCPYKCNWCAKPIYGNRYNSRSPRHVVQEIGLLLRDYQPDHFWMSDDIFGLKPGWVQNFKEAVQEKKIKFRYKIQSRVDLLLQEDTIKALADSGADTVWVGAESGSQKILDAMDKGTTVAEIDQATALLKHYGIKVGFFLQFGYPGETFEDIHATLKMVLRLMPDEIGISVSYPLPGTKFYENVKDELHDKQNWSNSDDLAMMFRGTFTPSFYKVLHRYIHSRYRIQRGINHLKNKTLAPGARNVIRNIVSMVYHIPVSMLQFYQLRKLKEASPSASRI